MRNLFGLVLLVGLLAWTSVLTARAASHDSSASAPYGCDLVVGPAAAPAQLIMSTLFHTDVSPGIVPYSVYESMESPSRRDQVQAAVPIALGDTIDGEYCIEATLTKRFGVDNAGKPVPDGEIVPYQGNVCFQFSQGHCFSNNRFEAVVGSEIPRLTGKSLGDLIAATHGRPLNKRDADVHPQRWKIVGVLAATGTAADRTAYIPLGSFYAIDEHALGMIDHHAIAAGLSLPRDARLDQATPPPADAQGIVHFKNYDLDTIHGTYQLTLPREDWFVSAVLVKTKGTYPRANLAYDINAMPGEMAVDPIAAARHFSDVFGGWEEWGFMPAPRPRGASDRNDGVVIGGVLVGSPAATAGLQRGDLVVQVNETPVYTCFDLQAALAAAQPSAKATLKLRRGGTSLAVDAVLSLATSN